MGWERKLRRAQRRLQAIRPRWPPHVLASLAATERFSVTDLERFGDCSSIWFVERMLRPGEIDFELDAKLRGSVAHATLARFFAQLPGGGRQSIGSRPTTVEAAWPVMLRCLHEALGGQRVGDTVGGRELARGLERDLEAFLRAEADLNLEFVPRRFEVRFGGASSPPGLKEGLKHRRLRGHRHDRPHRHGPRHVAPRGACGTTSPARPCTRPPSSRVQGKLQLPLYIMALRDLLGIEPIGGLYRALAGKREARGMVLAAEIGDAQLNKRDRLDAEAFWQHVEDASDDGDRGRPADSGGRRAPRPARRALPLVVHLLHRLPGAEAVSRDWNPEQAEAISRDGHVFVSAGAGTGKTAVLVERVLRRIDAGTSLDRHPRDHLHRPGGVRAEGAGAGGARAARRLRSRAGGGLGLDLDHPPLLHPDSAKPRDRRRARPPVHVADDVGARILQSEAFDNALERFLSEDGAVGSRRLDLLAAYSRRRLRELLLEAYERLRSAGRPLDLRPHGEPDLDAAGRRRTDRRRRCDKQQAADLVAFSDTRPDAAELVDLRRSRWAGSGACADYDAGPPRPRAGGPRRAPRSPTWRSWTCC